MFVKKLVLHHFRSYPELDVSFPERGIYITGENGKGKTNLLEAIDYLALGRSFRRVEDQELISNGEKEASIYLEYHDESDGKDHVLSCLIGQGYKAMEKDGEKLKTLSKMLGSLLSVHYDPSLVFFFKEEPMERRKFLDEVLSQVDPKYLYALSRYKKLLKERNTALAKDYDLDVLNVLKEQLIVLSYRLVQERKRLIQVLSSRMESYYQKLFGEEKEIHLLYKTTCSLEDSQESYVQEMRKLFDSNRSAENLRKTTLIGPHRDNLLSFLEGKDIALQGSQGENRLASLALRLALREFFQEKKGKGPLLLLDDVTSDLDEKRAENLLSLIKDKGQVFVTGTQIRKGYDAFDTYICQDNTLRRK